jgi:hypothetical protein
MKTVAAMLVWLETAKNDRPNEVRPYIHFRIALGANLASLRLVILYHNQTREMAVITM